ncbi:MAG: urease accessory protein [Piscirickettsiaceae bacterium]|nr:MAG: urease accessory protein [Piscirickettsiaceae bacterium]
MLSVLTLGFLLGLRHALEADHVAAVASLVSKSGTTKNTMRLGAIWGFGHTLALFLFSLIFMLTDSVLPDRLAMGLEFVVGIMLVLLGADVIRRLIKDKVHFHTHQHGNNQTHFHAHKHVGEKNHDDSKHDHEHHANFSLRALYIGLMHGMAGSAALIILTLQSVDSLMTGISYILVFGVGSMVGMAALSAVIALPFRQSAKGLNRVHNGLQAVIGSITIVIGGFVIFQSSVFLV